MLRNTLCIAFLALTLIGAADIARSASTHLATFLAAAAADSMVPTSLAQSRHAQRHIQVASRY